MNAILGTIPRRRFRDSYDSMLGRHVAYCPRRAIGPEDTSNVDDPAAVTVGVRVLGAHLEGCVLCAEEDTFEVDGNGGVEPVFRIFPDGTWVAGFEGDTGIVYHAAGLH